MGWRILDKKASWSLAGAVFSLIRPRALVYLLYCDNYWLHVSNILRRRVRMTKRWVSRVALTLCYYLQYHCEWSRNIHFLSHAPDNLGSSLN